MRARLIGIPTMILLAGLIATLVIIAASARGRVQAEARSGMRLGSRLLTDALMEVRRSPHPERAFVALIANLPRVRHVTFGAGDRQAPAATGSLARLLAPRRLEQVFLVTSTTGRGLGRIVMRSNPADEVGEIRDELVGLTALLVAVWGVIILLIHLAVARGLRPLEALGEALDGLERGVTALVPPTEVMELRQIGERVNALAAALAQATADNRLLIERLMSIQEAERGQLAAELHDEIGPLLFGIRADAACILRWTVPAPLEARREDISSRARSLGAYADGLQRINSRMLKRLRPIVLDEMGLTEAVRAMVAAWAERAPGIEWKLEAPTAIVEPVPAVALAAFRIVQEALTNAARHSGARTVDIALEQDGDVLAISVRDDGCGLRADARRGFGLLGMSERARQAQGAFCARRARDGGTQVLARLPTGGLQAADAAQCASC